MPERLALAATQPGRERRHREGYWRCRMSALMTPEVRRSIKIRLQAGGRAFCDPDIVTLWQHLEAVEADLAAAKAKLNTPELHDFRDAVVLEAAHQRERWGSNHDVGKTPADWFWLLGHLSGKALAAHSAGNTDKALHHTISSAACLSNWHASILGQTNMRPGIDGAAIDAARKEPR